MKRKTYLPVLLLFVGVFASTIMFQGCKKKDPDVENIKTWSAEDIKESQEVTVRFSMGDKDGEQWISAYDFTLKVTDGASYYEIIKTRLDNKGITEFSGDEVKLSLVSENIEEANHYFASNSVLTIKRLQGDNSRFGVNYTVYMNDETEFSGTTVAEIK